MKRSKDYVFYFKGECYNVTLAKKVDSPNFYAKLGNPVVFDDNGIEIEKLGLTEREQNELFQEANFEFEKSCKDCKKKKDFLEFVEKREYTIQD